MYACEHTCTSLAVACSAGSQLYDLQSVMNHWSEVRFTTYKLLQLYKCSIQSISWQDQLFIYSLLTNLFAAQWWSDFPQFFSSDSNSKMDNGWFWLQLVWKVDQFGETEREMIAVFSRPYMVTDLCLQVFVILHWHLAEMLIIMFFFLSFCWVKLFLFKLNRHC